MWPVEEQERHGPQNPCPCNICLFTVKTKLGLRDWEAQRPSEDHKARVRWIHHTSYLFVCLLAYSWSLDHLHHLHHLHYLPLYCVNSEMFTDRRSICYPKCEHESYLWPHSEHATGLLPLGSVPWNKTNQFELCFTLCQLICQGHQPSALLSLLLWIPDFLLFSLFPSNLLIL